MSRNGIMEKGAKAVKESMAGVTKELQTANLPKMPTTAYLEVNSDVLAPTIDGRKNHAMITFDVPEKFVGTAWRWIQMPILTPRVENTLIIIRDATEGAPAEPLFIPQYYMAHCQYPSHFSASIVMLQRCQITRALPKKLTIAFLCPTREGKIAAPVDLPAWTAVFEFFE